MSLDKAINHGKEYRKPYYGSSRHDPTCRPHGGCPHCTNNRAHKNRARAAGAREESLYWETEESKQRSQETD